MRIKIKKDKEKIQEAYDEMLALIAMHKKIERDPKQVIKTYPKRYKTALTVFGIWLLIVLGCIITSILQDNTENLGSYSFMWIIMLMFFIRIYKNKKAYERNSQERMSKEETENYLELTEEEIKLEIGTSETFTIAWDKILYVLINHYTIVFFPKDIGSVHITMSIENKEEIVEVVKKYKQEDKIIDNTNLYE